jgi:hypothetical protein
MSGPSHNGNIEFVPESIVLSEIMAAKSTKPEWPMLHATWCEVSVRKREINASITAQWRQSGTKHIIIVYWWG